MPFRLIKRRRDGRFELRLPERVRTVLAESCQGMAAWLAADPDDPALWRLFPDAYPDHPDHDAFYRLVARDQLQARKLADLELIERTALADTLSAEELDRWLRGLNTVRLALGTRLDASEEPPDVDPEDPLAPMWELYEVIGVLVASISDALADELPPEGRPEATPPPGLG